MSAKTRYPKDAFVAGVTKAFSCSKAEASMMFDFFSDNADTVPGSDIVASVQKFRRSKIESTLRETIDTPREKPGAVVQPAKPVAKAGKLTAEQEAALIKRFKTSIARRSLNFEHLFSLADSDDVGTVSLIGLRNAIQSQVPDFSSADLFALLRILDRNKNGTIDIEEYEAVMLADEDDLKSIADNDSRVELRKSQMDSQLGSQRSIVSSLSAKSVVSRSATSSTKNKAPANPAPQKPGVASKRKRVDAGEALRTIITDMQKKEIKPATLFEWTDTENEGSLPTMRLYKELADNLEIDKAKIAAAVKHMDLNGLGYVLKGDFINFMNPNNIPKDIVIDEMVQGDQAVNFGRTIGDFKENIISDKEEPKEKARNFKIKGSAKNIAVPTKPVDSIRNSILGSAVRAPLMKPRRTMDDAEFQAVVKELKQALMDNNVSAQTLFDDICIREDEKSPDYVPDPPGTEKAVTIKLFEALSQALPSFDKFKIRAVLQYIDIEKSGIVSREEFDVVFNVNPESGKIEESTVIEKESAGTINADIDAMYEELNRIKMYDKFFEECDTDNDGVVNILDIKAFLTLRLDEEKRELITPFIKLIKKLFKTDLIDQATILKLFSKKFKDVTDLREYRKAMIKLRDMANNEAEKTKMRLILKSCCKHPEGKLKVDELYNALRSMNIGIRDDILSILADDIVFTKKFYAVDSICTIDNFFTYLSSVVKDAAAINNVKVISQLVNAHITATTKAGLTSQALTVHLKSIKKSKVI